MPFDNVVADRVQGVVVQPVTINAPSDMGQRQEWFQDAQP